MKLTHSRTCGPTTSGAASPANRATSTQVCSASTLLTPADAQLSFERRNADNEEEESEKSYIPTIATRTSYDPCHLRADALPINDGDQTNRGKLNMVIGNRGNGSTHFSMMQVCLLHPGTSNLARSCSSIPTVSNHYISI